MGRKILITLLSILLPVLLFSQVSSSELYKFAYDLYKNANYNFAVEQFQKIISAYPDSRECGDAAYMTAECFYKQGEYEKAVPEYKTVLERYSSLDYRDTVMYRIGECLFRLKDYSGSEEAFKSLLDKNPKTYLAADANFWTAEAYFNGGEFENAAIAYETVSRDFGDYRSADYACYSAGWC